MTNLLTNFGDAGIAVLLTLIWVVFGEVPPVAITLFLVIALFLLQGTSKLFPLVGFYLLWRVDTSFMGILAISAWVGLLANLLWESFLSARALSEGGDPKLLGAIHAPGSLNWIVAALTALLLSLCTAAVDWFYFAEPYQIAIVVGAIIVVCIGARVLVMRLRSPRRRR